MSACSVRIHSYEVLDGVGDRDTSAGAHDAGHLGEHARGVLGVVEDHVRDCSVE
jgi:hypothetical protein